jgi:transposase
MANWNKIYKHLKRWSDRGILQYLFESVQKDADKDSISINSTIVRSHACAAGLRKNAQDEKALGRSKGGFSTKIHATGDALGLPLEFILTPGQRNDCTPAIELTK